MVLIYLIKGLISMPSSIQDMLIQIASTGGIGYVIVLLVQLYRIHPILPFVPVMVVAIIIHFFTHTNKDQTFARLSSSVVPLPDKNVRLPRLAPETSITNTANKNHTTRRQSVMAGISIVNELLPPLDKNDDISSDSNDEYFNNILSAYRNDFVDQISDDSRGHNISKYTFNNKNDNNNNNNNNNHNYNNNNNNNTSNNKPVESFIMCSGENSEFYSSMSMSSDVSEESEYMIQYLNHWHLSSDQDTENNDVMNIIYGNNSN
jgi:hypothetical protein